MIILVIRRYHACNGYNSLAVPSVPNFSTHGFRLLIMKSASCWPLLAVCLVSVCDWKHFRWWPAAGEGVPELLKLALLIDPTHILKIKDSIKGIAKLLMSLHAPKKGTSDSVNKQSRWWMLVGAITPSTPTTSRRTAEVFYFNAGWPCGSRFDWHLSLIRGRKSSLGKSSVQIN